MFVAVFFVKMEMCEYPYIYLYLFKITKTIPILNIE